MDPEKQTEPDTKEGLYFGREVPEDSEEARTRPLHGPNQWPDAVRACRVLPMGGCANACSIAASEPHDAWLDMQRYAAKSQRSRRPFLAVRRLLPARPCTLSCNLDVAHAFKASVGDNSLPLTLTVLLTLT